MNDPKLGLTRFTWGTLLVGAALRGFVLAHGIERVDRAYVLDDAYYTLSIARSLVADGFPIASGRELTTGFQPLLALLEMPAFVFGSSADGATMWALACLAVVDLGVGLLLARLARIVAGERAEMIAAVLTLLSSVMIGEAFVGLEAPLATLTTLGAALMLERVLSQAPSRGTLLSLGALAGACVLARIDTAPFLVCLAGAMVWKKRSRQLAIVIASALAVGGLWLLVCLVHNGRPWPESGAAVMRQTQEGGSVESVMRLVSFAAGWILPGSAIDAAPLRVWLVEHEGIGLVVGLATLGLMAHGARRAPLAARVWIAGALALAPFYIFVLPAIWAYHRYLFPLRVVMTLLIAVAAARAFRGRWPVVALAVVELGLSVREIRARLSGPARGDIMVGLTGYREAVMDIYASAPPDMVVSAMQSGALGFFKPATVTVINLDGVVSGKAQEAYAARKLDERLRDEHVTHLADWSSNLKDIMRHGAKDAYRVRLGVRGQPQGTHQFVLAEIVWPDAVE